jgi:uncharacterized protein
VGCGDVTDFRLDADHRLLFNPLGSGGVVVVNESAYDILCAIADPATVADVRRGRPGRGPEVTSIFQRLGQLQLIHPEGQPPKPSFRPGQVLTAWLHETNGCNLQCPYCYLAKSPDPMEATGRAAVAGVMRSAATNGLPAVKPKYADGEARLNHRLVITLHAYARELVAGYSWRRAPGNGTCAVIAYP